MTLSYDRHGLVICLSYHATDNRNTASNRTQYISGDTHYRYRFAHVATFFMTDGTFSRLATLDPVTAARLKPNDSQRIQRALEIIALSGQPMSSLLAQRTSQALPFTLLPLALEPSERGILHERIALRFDMMLANDQLLDEVRALRARGDLHLGLPSMRCVGYRQAWEHLDGAYDLATFREKGIIATRQLAKRQLTWLRSMPDRITVDCNAPDAAATVLRHVERAVAAAG